MSYLEKFKSEKKLIEKHGEELAYLIWAIALYLNFPDMEQLAIESVTEGGGDKDIDFIRLEDRKLIIVQSTYSKNGAFYTAPAKKASSLNNALAWIFSGDIDKVTEKTEKFKISLKEIILDCRQALESEAIDEIEIIYLHNFSESQNVADELITVKDHLKRLLKDHKDIEITTKELGAKSLEKIYQLIDSSIKVQDEIKIPHPILYREHSDKWRSAILSISGVTLKSLYDQYKDDLFSANYRGYLGVNKRKRNINKEIKNTIEQIPENFWAYNNGITILTTKFEPSEDDANVTILHGISIINGAQTTGSIAHSDSSSNLTKIKILCRIVVSDDNITRDNIIKYNNSQNEIKTWDSFSNDEKQKVLKVEFDKLHIEYSHKRGFDSTSTNGLSIELVAQPLASLHGNYVDAGSGRNYIFDTPSLYKDTFEKTKARHALLAFCLVKAYENVRSELKNKVLSSKSTTEEDYSLKLTQHLKFKFFVISIIGDCIEILLGERVDKYQIAFKSGVSKANNNSLEILANKCVPIIKPILRQIGKIITNGFDDQYHKKERYNQVVSQIKENLNITVDHVGLEAFSNIKEIISPTGFES